MSAALVKLLLIALPLADPSASEPDTVQDSVQSTRALATEAASIIRRAATAEEDLFLNRSTVCRPGLRSRLAALIGTLAAYAETPTDELASSVTAQLDALSASSAAEPLVAAVRDYYDHPNLWIDVSAELLEDSIRGEIDRWDKIDTVILDTPVTGKGRVQALRELIVEPRPDGAIFKIVIEGTIDSHTVSRRGPARLHSHALTAFRAEKPLLLTPTGLIVSPTVCRAETETLDSKATSNKGGLRGWVVRRLAERRSKDLRAAADDESSLHAQKKLLESIDREAGALVERLERVALLPITALTAASGGNPLEISCEGRVLRIGATVGLLGAPPCRPACDERQLFTVRVHESLLRRLQTSQPQPALSAPLGSQLAARLVRPRFTAAGVTLRDGNWGTILPVSIGEWLALEWRPPVVQRLAQRPADR